MKPGLLSISHSVVRFISRDIIINIVANIKQIIVHFFNEIDPTFIVKYVEFQVIPAH